MKVDTIHEQYNEWEKIWQRIKDCVRGQDAIKKKKEVYLPRLNGQDYDLYERYLQRAQFTNFTGRTLNISLGQIFRKKPLVEDVDEEILNNIDLSGQTFYYFSRSVLSEMMQTNRCGILVDWSDSLARPYLIKYDTCEIINWKEDNINGLNQLSLVVLEGWKEKQAEDMFDVEKEKIWRVLWLNEGVYTVSVYAEIKDKKSEFVKIEEDKIPLKDGKAFGYIPFYFCTSQGVSVKIEKPVLYDFANINIGHYINSADYENMLHITGAKTLVTKGYGDSKPIPIGGSFDLPTDGDAKYLEASSDSGLKEEMNKKAENMAVMGATLISGQGRYIASSDTSRINSQGEYATLADMSKALSDCMTQIMKELVDWQGVDSKNVSVKYNVDFELAEVDPNMLTAFMGAVQSGYMSWETYFYNMKNKELYPPEWTIEDEQKAIDERKEDMEELNAFEQDSNKIPKKTNKIEQDN